MNRLPTRLAAAALAAQIGAMCAFSSAAQPLTTGRASVSANDPSARAGEGRRPTVESASHEAQAAIRACDDRTAISCVAGVLTRYATTLQEIADERRAQPRTPSHTSP